MGEDQFDYINRTYGLNIKAGTRCVYTGDKGGKPRTGKVSHADPVDRHYIRICFDSVPGIAAGPFHPTWELQYLDGETR